jgi:uncharacterized protein with LGFP repeats
VRRVQDRLALVCTALLLAALAVVVLPPGGAGTTPGAPVVVPAADARKFDPGNIITDQLFFDGGAMSAAEVQTFLNVRNPSCVAADDGTPCLKNYRLTTTTIAGNDRCPRAYTGARDETAATIIAKVGIACGISQRVLLVMLQKEQGLVTYTGNRLTKRKYREAMGYACPDTATCDPAYAGFFKQVYTAAGRFNHYAANPGSFNHRAGQVNQVRFHPNAACGSSAVTIRNQATAGLYNYTPYQPNAAALAAGYLEGDACSAYGNRNFWLYFTDWFGSTQTPGAGALADRYVATGGAQGPLGKVTTAVSCGLRDGGCFQGYANGAIYWSPTTGAKVVLNGAIRTKWASLGWERGALGYPTSDVQRTPGGAGWFGHFQGGSVYWSSATGSHTVSGAIRSRWAALGWQAGSLGYPTSDQKPTPDGGAQYVHFQGGSLYWSPSTGARVVAGPVRTAWANMGWQTSPLGLPVSDVGATPDGRARFGHFVGGSLYVVDGVPRALPLPVVAAWRRSGWERGALGYPSAALAAAPGGRGEVMAFAGGSVYVVDGAGLVLHGQVEDAYAAAGGPAGELGLPVSDVTATSDGRARYADFEAGSVYVIGGAKRVLPEAIADAWQRTGRQQGPLGYPTGDVSAVAGGTTMPFEGGTVYAADGAGSAFALSGEIDAAYAAADGVTGSLGYPTADLRTTPDGGGRYAHFQRGSIYWTSSTGARTVAGPVKDRWAATGWERGLGYPTSNVTSTPDRAGEFAHFQRGSIYWTPSTGARVVSGPVRNAWAAAGWEHGPGYPTTDVTRTPDRIGEYAHFQRASIYWTPSTGARLVSGPVKDRWAASGWERGLGYPTTSVAETPDGVGSFAHFQRGSVYWTSGTGAHTVTGAARTAWANSGWERGPLGYPTSEPYRVTGGTRQDFQRGWITTSSSTGRATVTRR